MTIKIVDTVIIGGGFAGATTAYALARRGQKKVVILEQEAIAGHHASGRNAAFILASMVDSPNSWVARKTLDFIADPPDDFEGTIDFAPNGYLCIGGPHQAEQLAAYAAGLSEMNLPNEALDTCDLHKRFAELAGSQFSAGIFCPTDGVVDIHALLNSFVRAARRHGATLRVNARVHAIEAQGDGFLVTTDADIFCCAQLVNGAGAWANRIAELAGASRQPLSPCRRHLMTTRNRLDVAPNAPMVWSLDDNLYYRPEGQGLLICACDVTETIAGNPTVDPAINQLLAERLTTLIPRLRTLEIANTWACLRTLTPDDRFIIGEDPIRPNFFWIAGLGGHGVSGSGVIGELAADAILGQSTVDFEASCFAPARFIVR